MTAAIAITAIALGGFAFAAMAIKYGRGEARSSAELTALRAHVAHYAAAVKQQKEAADATLQQLAAVVRTMGHGDSARAALALHAELQAQQRALGELSAAADMPTDVEPRPPAGASDEPSLLDRLRGAGASSVDAARRPLDQRSGESLQGDD